MDPVQITLDGRQEPLHAAQTPQQDQPAVPVTPERLFAAPQTVRGQIALDTDG